MRINAVEVSPGNVEVSCENSGLPITRTNEYGIFCDADNCVCEKDSMKASASLDKLIDDVMNQYLNFQQGEQND